MIDGRGLLMCLRFRNFNIACNKIWIATVHNLFPSNNTPESGVSVKTTFTASCLSFVSGLYLYNERLGINETGAVVRQCGGWGSWGESEKVKLRERSHMFTLTFPQCERPARVCMFIYLAWCFEVAISTEQRLPYTCGFLPTCRCGS